MSRALPIVNWSRIMVRRTSSNCLWTRMVRRSTNDTKQPANPCAGSSELHQSNNEPTETTSEINVNKGHSEDSDDTEGAETLMEDFKPNHYKMTMRFGTCNNVPKAEQITGTENETRSSYEGQFHNNEQESKILPQYKTDFITENQNDIVDYNISKGDDRDASAWGFITYENALQKVEKVESNVDDSKKNNNNNAVDYSAQGEDIGDVTSPTQKDPELSDVTKYFLSEFKNLMASSGEDTDMSKEISGQIHESEMPEVIKYFLSELNEPSGNSEELEDANVSQEASGHIQESDMPEVMKYFLAQLNEPSGSSAEIDDVDESKQTSDQNQHSEVINYFLSELNEPSGSSAEVEDADVSMNSGGPDSDASEVMKYFLSELNEPMASDSDTDDADESTHNMMTYFDDTAASLTEDYSQEEMADANAQGQTHSDFAVDDYNIANFKDIEGQDIAETGQDVTQTDAHAQSNTDINLNKISNFQDIEGEDYSQAEALSESNTDIDLNKISNFQDIEGEDYSQAEALSESNTDIDLNKISNFQDIEGEDYTQTEAIARTYQDDYQDSNITETEGQDYTRITSKESNAVISMAQDSWEDYVEQPVMSYNETFKADAVTESIDQDSEDDNVDFNQFLEDLHSEKEPEASSSYVSSPTATQSMPTPCTITRTFMISPDAKFTSQQDASEVQPHQISQESTESRLLMRYALIDTLRKLENGQCGIKAKIVITEQRSDL